MTAAVIRTGKSVGCLFWCGLVLRYLSADNLSAPFCRLQFGADSGVNGAEQRQFGADSFSIDRLSAEGLSAAHFGVA